MARPPATVCARLGQDQPYGPTDVCGLQAGHEGAHQGRYRGMVWEDVPGKPHRAKIQGPTTITGNIPEGGNIRGNQ